MPYQKLLKINRYFGLEPLATRPYLKSMHVLSAQALSLRWGDSMNG